MSPAGWHLWLQCARLLNAFLTQDTSSPSSQQENKAPLLFLSAKEMGSFSEAVRKWINTCAFQNGLIAGGKQRGTGHQVEIKCLEKVARAWKRWPCRADPASLYQKSKFPLWFELTVRFPTAHLSATSSQQSPCRQAAMAGSRTINGSVCHPASSAVPPATDGARRQPKGNRLLHRHNQIVQEEMERKSFVPPGCSC